MALLFYLVITYIPHTDSSISPGHFTTSVQCNNTVSSVTTQTSYLMVQKVTGLVVSASQQFAAQDENITLTVSRTGGEKYKCDVIGLKSVFSVVLKIV